MTTTAPPPLDTQAAELARLIKRAAEGRSWCATKPLQIAKYLLAQGVSFPHLTPPVEPGMPDEEPEHDSTEDA